MPLSAQGKPVLAAFWDGSDKAFAGGEVVDKQGQGGRGLGEEHCEAGAEWCSPHDPEIVVIQLEFNKTCFLT